jgi:hypothetical protein
LCVSSQVGLRTQAVINKRMPATRGVLS